MSMTDGRSDPRDARDQAPHPANPNPGNKGTGRFPDIRELSFESALKELEQIVGRLERGDVELEESIAIWERGEALKEHCDRQLKAAEARVERITLDSRGQPSGAQAMELEATQQQARMGQ
jgi:exodeoxyribonuclease VII small subunit